MSNSSDLANLLRPHVTQFLNGTDFPGRAPHQPASDELDAEIEKWYSDINDRISFIANYIDDTPGGSTADVDRLIPAGVTPEIANYYNQVRTNLQAYFDESVAADDPDHRGAAERVDAHGNSIPGSLEAMVRYRDELLNLGLGNARIRAFGQRRDNPRPASHNEHDYVASRLQGITNRPVGPAADLWVHTPTPLEARLQFLISTDILSLTRATRNTRLRYLENNQIAVQAILIQTLIDQPSSTNRWVSDASHGRRRDDEGQQRLVRFNESYIERVGEAAFDALQWVADRFSREDTRTAAEQEELERVSSLSQLLSREGQILATLTPRIVKLLNNYEYHPVGEDESVNLRAVKNIIQISDRNFSSLPSALGHRDNAKDWFEADNKVLSALIPKARFLKRNYHFDQETGIYQPQQESFTKLRFENFLTERAIDAITNGTSGKSGGYGITNIEIESLGNTIGTERLLQRINVNIFAQSLTDLLPKDIEEFGKPDDDSPLQLILAGYSTPERNILEQFEAPADDAAAAASQTPTELAIGAARERVTDTLNSLNVNPNAIAGIKRDIILELGWDGASEHDDPDVSRMSPFLEKQLTRFYLNQVSFSFSFNSDGSFNLNIEFIGRADLVLSDDNLNVLSMLSPVNSFINDFNRTEALTQMISIDNADDGPGTLERSLVARKNEENILNNYSSMLASLFEGTKIYKLIINKEHIIRDRDGMLERISRMDEVDISEELQRLFLEKYDVLALSNAQIDIDILRNTPNDDDEDMIARFYGIEEIQEALQDIQPEGARDAFGQAVGQTERTLFFNAARHDTYNILFFRFGDILEALIESARENHYYQGLGEDLEPYIISGPITYSDLVNGKSYHLNVCDILISLRQFREFFFERIVLKLATKYPLKQFIRDIVTEFSQRNMLTGVLEASQLPAASQAFFTTTQQHITLKDEYQDVHIPVIDDVSTADSPAQRLGQYVDYNTPGSVGRTLFLMEGYDSLIGIPADANETDIDDWKNQDFRRGIYWFEFGRDRGILKDVQFSKQTIQGLRDAAIIRSQQELGFVRSEPYNADITLVGSSFMFPGQYIYFNPTNALGISVESFSQASFFGNLLQIGGYYFVTKADHSYDVSSGNFITRLTCVWQTNSQRDAQSYSFLSELDASLATITSDAGEVLTEITPEGGDTPPDAGTKAPAVPSVVQDVLDAVADNPHVEYSAAWLASELAGKLADFFRGD